MDLHIAVYAGTVLFVAYLVRGVAGFGSGLIAVPLLTLVAPVPRIQIMLGRTLGAATVASIQGMLVMVVCFVAGFRLAGSSRAPLALLFMALIACTFSALGTALGAGLENMQGFQLTMNFLVMPIFFLSGALYPLTNLPAAFSFVVRLDPLLAEDADLAVAVATRGRAPVVPVTFLRHTATPPQPGKRTPPGSRFGGAAGRPFADRAPARVARDASATVNRPPGRWREFPGIGVLARLPSGRSRGARQESALRMAGEEFGGNGED